MLHGHAKIELTNVKTGEKKIIEHDNMLTGWIRDIFTPHGVEGHNLSQAQLNATNQTTQEFTKEKLFRGVILFEDEVTNNADDYCFPAANKMTAHGDDQAYSGSDLTRGSFNAELSSSSETEMVSVWDWTQERGNGTISALGLCNRWAGGVGSGQAIPDENLYYFPLFCVPIFSGSQSGTTEMKIQNAAWMSYTDSILYILRSMASGVLTIAKKYLPISKYDAVMQKVIAGGRQGYSYYDASKEAEITVDISAYITGNTLPAFTAKDGVIYMLPTGNWSSGSKTLVKYDIAAGTVTTQTVTNNTGKTLYVNNTAGSWGIFGNELYFQTTESLFAYINLQDNTDCGIVKDLAGNNVTYNGSGGGSRMLAAFENFYFSYSTLQTASNQIWTIKAKGRAAKTGAGGFNRPTSYSSNLREIVAVPGNDRKQFFDFAYNDYAGQRWMIEAYNWLALSTKQNLDSAVTKTSDMTMRVTYTIREAT